MNTLKGCKNGRFLEFTRDNRSICYDLADNKWKRFLKNGTSKEIGENGVAHFFRGIEHDQISGSFDDKVFSKLIHLIIKSSRKRRNSNFSKIFENYNEYKHMESYMLLNIQYDSNHIFQYPVNNFTKPVIRFMIESQFEFSRSWELKFSQSPQLFTNFCQYVLTNYHDNLLIYRHLYDILMTNFDKLACLIGNPDTVNRCGWAESEHGFGAEYKAVFDYVVYCVAVEAMYPNDVVEEYFDYLKMARKVQQIKVFNSLKNEGKNIRLQDVGFPNWNQIEKYPKGLTVRHRIVTRNFKSLERVYNESKFANIVDHNYAWCSGEYCMITANKPDDVKFEGNDLNHCVESYIDAILTGRTQITFLRKSESPNKSLVTVEIRSNAIQQARGYANRDITDEERNWLEKYAKAKNLTYGKQKHNPQLPCPTPNTKDVSETAA